MNFLTFESPIGNITISEESNKLTQLHIAGDRYFKKVPKNWKYDATDSFLREAKKQVLSYLHGESQQFHIPLILKGTTFQQEVWQELLRIPYGQTTSYASIAERINKPKAMRAVGTAIGRNPLCLIIPCHRILASSGSLGGYVAGTGIKQELLQIERSKILNH